MDVIVQADVRLDIPDWLKAITGLWLIEQIIRDNLSPLVIALNGVIESLFLIGEHPIPAFTGCDTSA